MRLLRRIFGLDFPDPEVGQVWRSRHSGRAVRVADVRPSDCGKLWHIGLQHEGDRGFIPIPMSYCMFPSQWRRMLREEGRQLMGGGLIEPSKPWPRTRDVPAVARSCATCANHGDGKRIPGVIGTPCDNCAPPPRLTNWTPIAGVQGTFDTEEKNHG